MMKDASQIPTSNIARLPRYYRFLSELEREGVKRISSNDLAERMSVTASQIRQDFSCFGITGQQGFGYSVEQIKNSIAELLGLDRQTPAILLGAGNLGRAIGTLRFSDKGFRLCAVFDTDPRRVGQTVAGLTVKDARELRGFCESEKPECAFLCLPEDKAPDAVEELIDCGVTCFWNFSHYDIKKSHPGTVVENVHLSDSLMKLSYLISKNQEDEQ